VNRPVAVVKYNLDTGDLGVARGDDGAIKTFFRPNDIQYIMRKVRVGAWAEPAAADGFERATDTLSFSDHPEVTYLFSRLERLGLELPSQTHETVLALPTAMLFPIECSVYLHIWVNTASACSNCNVEF
jgi:hypothetical protein